MSFFTREAQDLSSRPEKLEMVKSINQWENQQLKSKPITLSYAHQSWIYFRDAWYWIVAKIRYADIFHIILAGSDIFPFV